jgi:hypothetical protein
MQRNKADKSLRIQRYAGVINASRSAPASELTLQEIHSGKP